MNAFSKSVASLLRKALAKVDPSENIVDLSRIKDGIVIVGGAQYWHRTLVIDDDRRRQAEFHTRLERERRLERESAASNVAKIKSSRPTTFPPQHPRGSA